MGKLRNDLNIMPEKIFIKNRDDLTVVVLLEQNPVQNGLVFVAHGLGGFKEQPQMQMLADVFTKKGYTVVRFDTTNTLGESDGDYADATVTNYYADLEDVIRWAETQTWYQEPFVLVGHSLGGMTVTLYAQKYPEKVKALAPLSTVVSGELSLQTKKSTGELEEWKRTGWRISKSESKPGAIKRLKWSHMEDRLKYDLLPNIGQLTMPTLLVVGELDDATPVEHQQMLYNHLPAKKEIHIIKNAPHTFRDPKYLQEIKKIFAGWISRI